MKTILLILLAFATAALSATNDITYRQLGGDGKWHNRTVTLLPDQFLRVNATGQIEVVDISEVGTLLDVAEVDVNWTRLIAVPAPITSIAPLIPAADRGVYYTGASTASLFPLTAFGRTILDDPDAATVRATIGAGTGDALTTNPLSQFAATTSAQLAGVLSDETGTGTAVFSASPTLSGTVTISGAATPSISVSGIAWLLGGIYAEGATNYFEGSGTFDGGLSVTGTSSLTGALNVVGAGNLTSLGGNLTVNGTINVNSSSTLNGAQTLAGASSLTNASVSMSALPTHADNAAAVTAGLAVGRIYKTATGELRIVVP